METKIIPFDLETAKKIQAGEINGRIRTRAGNAARIVCWDMRDNNYPIVAVIQLRNREGARVYTTEGKRSLFQEKMYWGDLILEVPKLPK